MCRGMGQPARGGVLLPPRAVGWGGKGAVEEESQTGRPQGQAGR